MTVEQFSDTIWEVGRATVVATSKWANNYYIIDRNGGRELVDNLETALGKAVIGELNA